MDKVLFIWIWCMFVWIFLKSIYVTFEYMQSAFSVICMFRMDFVHVCMDLFEVDLGY
jgi:hypothetical protein